MTKRNWVNATATIIVTWLLVALIVSASSGAHRPEDAPSALVVHHDAEGVMYHEQGGIWHVSYSVKAHYPADDVLKFIGDKLSQSGWMPLAEDIFNPGVRSSHVRGWTSFRDARTSPKTKIHQWLAQWRSSNGDVVWFRLQYRYPVGLAMPNVVYVNGTFDPSSIVEEQMREIQKEQAGVSTKK